MNAAEKHSTEAKPNYGSINKLRVLKLSDDFETGTHRGTSQPPLKFFQTLDSWRLPYAQSNSLPPSSLPSLPPSFPPLFVQPFSSSCLLYRSLSPYRAVEKDM